MSRKNTERFETIDALRGLAALSVVFWHWQWLYCQLGDAICPAPDGPIQYTQPMFFLFQPLYEFGGYGVELFFTISGFVFFYLYAEAISDRTVGAWAFIVNRVSRLYPLHLATLLMVAAIQLVIFQQYGAFFIFQTNDAKHFLMQLFFASNWSWSPYSFNGPIWSVSIEVLLYALFFIVARTKLLHPIALALIAIAGLVIMQHHSLIGRGVVAFFNGGLCYYVIRRWQKHERAALPLACIAMVSIATVLLKYAPAIDKVLVAFAFPAIVIGLAANEERLKPISRYIGWLGDISYSSYLIHFPLALSLVTASTYLGLRLDPSSPFLMIGYFAALIALSLASFHWLERPAQKFLRSNLLSCRWSASAKPGYS